MSTRYKFDAQKAVEVLLYIAQKSPDVYHALKVLYFADKDHLAKYGRLICGDKYIAMKHGPVPSGAYDLIKFVRGDFYWWIDNSIDEAFTVDNNTIKPLREPNLDLLSETDIECLDESIERISPLPFPVLKRLSHQDEAFKQSDENDTISLEAIVRSLPDGDLLLDYLQSE